MDENEKEVDRRAVFIGRLPFRVHVTGRYHRLGCPRGIGAKASHGGVGTYLWAPLGSSPLGLGFWPLGETVRALFTKLALLFCSFLKTKLETYNI
jgi:hypothetical protein